MSGTCSPRNSGGLVYCGYSSRPCRKRIIACRLFRTEDSRQQPADSINNGHRRQFTAGHDKITERKFFGSEKFFDPFVNPFIAATDNDDIATRSKFSSKLLAESDTAGR